MFLDLFNFYPFNVRSGFEFLFLYGVFGAIGLVILTMVRRTYGAHLDGAAAQAIQGVKRLTIGVVPAPDQYYAIAQLKNGTAGVVDTLIAVAHAAGCLRPKPEGDKLTADERQSVLNAAHREEFRDLSPRQIVPRLADAGEYIASESTFYRVLREAGELAHRGRANPRKHHRPKEHIASAPNQVWSWDNTYLRSATRGAFFYLYLIVDIYSRKLVGWRVEGEESALLASELVAKTVAIEGVDANRLVLHADNGGPMKGSTMLATLQRLGIVPSFSRPRVSDDNPYAEALFKTLKYRPGFPSKPFASIDAAREWIAGFVAWYNDEHRHSGLGLHTPADVHYDLAGVVRDKRAAVLDAAYAAHPERFPRKHPEPPKLPTVSWINPPDTGTAPTADDDEVTS